MLNTMFGYRIHIVYCMKLEKYFKGNFYILYKLPYNPITFGRICTSCWNHRISPIHIRFFQSTFSLKMSSSFEFYRWLQPFDRSCFHAFNFLLSLSLSRFFSISGTALWLDFLFKLTWSCFFLLCSTLIRHTNILCRKMEQYQHFEWIILNEYTHCYRSRLIYIIHCLVHCQLVVRWFP